MYPAQTSLIPATVALARFFAENGFSAFNHLYPYWYLDSTPFRYLTGPVAPVIFTTLNKLFPTATLFTITIYIVLLSLLLSAAGWGLFSYALSKDKRLGLAVSLLTIILPWRYLSSLAMDEASFVLARNFLPFALLAVWSFLKATSWKSILWALLAATFLLLINTSILPILLVGVSGLVLARSYRKGKIRNISKYVKTGLTLIVCSLLLITLWYSPGYWLTILANPSIGGASSLKVIFRVFDLLKAAVPLVLAVGVVYFSGKVKDRFSIFILTWVLTFLFLTVFRFIGDPDFWMDWSSWFFELEVGLALLIAKSIADKNYLAAVGLIVLPILTSFYIYGLLGKQALISRSIPEGVSSLEKLAQIAGKENVFLSGSTVFWAGSTGASTELSRMSSPLVQVRGGRDQVAVHPSWDKAAYELREGHDPEVARRWLKELNISYVLVHGPTSGEYYHDFKNINKWGKVGDVVWEERGDMIYQVNGKR